MFLDSYWDACLEGHSRSKYPHGVYRDHRTFYEKCQALSIGMNRGALFYKGRYLFETGILGSCGQLEEQSFIAGKNRTFLRGAQDGAIQIR